MAGVVEQEDTKPAQLRPDDPSMVVCGFESRLHIAMLVN